MGKDKRIYACGRDDSERSVICFHQRRILSRLQHEHPKLGVAILGYNLPDDGAIRVQEADAVDRRRIFPQSLNIDCDFIRRSN